MSWLFDLAYVALLCAVSPILLWRMVDSRQISHGMGRKTSWAGFDPRERRALSLVSGRQRGRSAAIGAGPRRAARRLPGVEFVISTTTPTGLSVAGQEFPADHVCYFPLDFSWAVREAIRRLRPTAIVLVELELWPNFVFQRIVRAFPLALINGRVSQRSSRGYSHIRPLMSRLLAGLRSSPHKTRLRRAARRSGRPAKPTANTGSIKFDRVTTDRRNPRTEELRQFFGIALRATKYLSPAAPSARGERRDRRLPGCAKAHSNLRLIIVPRHKERFDEVGRLIESRGLPLVRRSQAPPRETNRQRSRRCSSWTRSASWPPVGGWRTWPSSAEVSAIEAART